MCNPRRIVVSATREIQDQWQREIVRRVRLTAATHGEARVERPLNVSMIGRPTLIALRNVMDADPNWQQVDGGFRRNVDGGHVVFRDGDTPSLEIVAECEGEVAATAEETATARYNLNETIEREGDAQIYDDDDRIQIAIAQRRANENVQQHLDEEEKERIEAARSRALRDANSAADAEATQRAQEDLNQSRMRQEAELRVEAQRQIEQVGDRCQQEFNHALAHAYKAAILNYAREHGAENIVCNEVNGVLEVEFLVQR